MDLIPDMMNEFDQDFWCRTSALEVVRETTREMTVDVCRRHLFVATMDTARDMLRDHGVPEAYWTEQGPPTAEEEAWLAEWRVPQVGAEAGEAQVAEAADEVGEAVDEAEAVEAPVAEAVEAVDEAEAMEAPVAEAVEAGGEVQGGLTTEEEAWLEAEALGEEAPLPIQAGVAEPEVDEEVIPPSPGLVEGVEESEGEAELVEPVDRVSSSDDAPLAEVRRRRWGSRVVLDEGAGTSSGRRGAPRRRRAAPRKRLAEGTAKARRRMGVEAEIAYLQSTEHPLCEWKPFARLCRAVVLECHGNSWHIQDLAITALKRRLERRAVEMFSAGWRGVLERGGDTPTLEDLQWGILYERLEVESESDFYYEDTE